jgi:hypothetical protein
LIAVKGTAMYVFVALVAYCVSGIAVFDQGNEGLRPAGYELGSVGSEDCVLGKFVLCNASEQELVLRNVRRNCACYGIAHSVNRLQPGESTTLTFDLTFPEGKRLRNAVFYILSNDREKPLRQFVVKLSQSDDPDFAASKPNRIIFHLLDDRPDDGVRGEAFSREQGALRVEKLSGSSGQAKYAAEFADGADIARVAKAYAEHPSVGLVLFRAAPEPAVLSESVEPSLPTLAPFHLQTGSREKPPTSLVLHWFYSEGCAFCDDVKRLLQRVPEQYAGRVLVKRYEISSLENYEKLILLEESLGITRNDPMVLFLGNACLSGHGDILDKLTSTIDAQLALGSPNVLTPSSGDAGIGTGRHVQRRFLSFSAVTVVAAGFLDGLNPCAFTTIVFFISFLAHVGKRKRELIIMGLTFSLAVFATYLLIGLGLFKALFVLSGYRLFAEILYYGIIALLLVFAGLSIHDCIVFSKTEQSKRILLQLPESFKRRIHDAIRKYAKRTNLVLGAAILGCVVTLFESVCTGQVYLPTIAFVLKHPDMRVNAFFYLILYNLMFILPLVVIFLLAYFGLKSDQLGNFFRGKVVLSKAALACLFVGLAVLLISTH